VPVLLPADGKSRIGSEAKKSIPPFEFPTFILTHQDISPRNLILDKSSYVWLIDWAFTGAYPPVFEAATLTAQLQFPDFNKQDIQQIDYGSEQVEQLKSIGWGLRVAALA
jgi:thiamine kinase-like enzyme